MSGLLKCLFYLAVTGVVLFLAGRMIPKKWILYNRFPYRTFPYEKDGRIYQIFHIQKWREKLPDMSKIFPGMMPSKKLPKRATAAQLEQMVQETCVAELVHDLLCVLGFGCVFLWKGAGGWFIALIYMAGNIPFSMIQRYNRPKLIQIMKRLKTREGVEIHEKSVIVKRQYGAGA